MQADAQDLTGRDLAMAARIPGTAGPAGFQRRFARELIARGAQVRYGFPARGAEAVLVIGATRNLPALIRAKRRGIPIIQRLDGMNWIHRVLRTGARHFLRAEVNNWLLRMVRRLADVIVYQSEFARRWWEREAGPSAAPTWVVHNGVPLDRYTPDGPEQRPSERIQLSVIEGNLAGGYQVGLQWAVELARGLEARLDRPVDMMVAGAVSPRVRAQFNGEIRWKGLLAPAEIPALHRASHMLFAADLHPACPNSVLEAMACGNPVVAFDTGAISELVDSGAGAIVPYGTDPWRVEPPDLPALVEAAFQLAEQQDHYRRGARKRAEAAFGLQDMVDGYLQALGWW